MAVRYRITFIDMLGEKKYYLNGASSENKEWAEHELELLEKDNLKHARCRSNFKIEPVEIKPFKYPVMKATDKKTEIESLGYEVKDFITKKNVIIKKDGVIYNCYSSIHSAYRSIVK